MAITGGPGPPAADYPADAAAGCGDGDRAGVPACLSRPRLHVGDRLWDVAGRSCWSCLGWQSRCRAWPAAGFVCCHRTTWWTQCIGSSISRPAGAISGCTWSRCGLGGAVRGAGDRGAAREVRMSIRRVGVLLGKEFRLGWRNVFFIFALVMPLSLHDHHFVGVRHPLLRQGAAGAGGRGCIGPAGPRRRGLHRWTHGSTRRLRRCGLPSADGRLDIGLVLPDGALAGACMRASRLADRLHLGREHGQEPGRGRHDSRGAGPRADRP